MKEEDEAYLIKCPHCTYAFYTRNGEQKLIEKCPSCDKNVTEWTLPTN